MFVIQQSGYNSQVEAEEEWAYKDLTSIFVGYVERLFSTNRELKKNVFHNKVEEMQETKIIIEN